MDPTNQAPASPVNTIVPGGPTVSNEPKKVTQAGRDYTVAPGAGPEVTKLTQDTIAAAGKKQAEGADKVSFQAKLEAKPLRKNVFEVSNFITRFFKSIQYWYHNKYTLQPKLLPAVEQMFQGADNFEKVEARWYQSESKIQHFVDRTYQQINGGQEYDLISRQEILNATRAKFEAKFKTLYKEYTGRNITSRDMGIIQNNKKVRDGLALFESIQTHKEVWIKNASKVWTIESITDRIKRLNEDIETSQNNLKGYTDEAFFSEEERAETSLEERTKILSDLIKAEEDLLTPAQSDLKNLLKTKESLLLDKTLFDQEQKKLIEAANLYWEKEVAPIPAMEMPLEELARIPVNELTKSALLDTWKNIFNQLRNEGRLTDLVSDTSKTDPEIALRQVSHADQYLSALQCMQKMLVKDLAEITNKIDRSKIEKFVWSQPITLGMRSLPETDTAKRRQIIFNDVLEPILHERIFKIRDQSDVTKFGEILRDREHNFIRSLSTELRTKLEEHGLTKDEITKFELTPDKLVDKIISSLEEEAIKTFSLSGDQIARLKSARNEQQVVFEKQLFAKSQMNDIKNYLVDYAEKMSKLKEIAAEQQQVDVPDEIQLPDFEVAINTLTAAEKEALIENNLADITKATTRITNILSQPVGKKGRDNIAKEREKIMVLEQQNNDLRAPQNAPTGNIKITIKGSLREVSGLSKLEIQRLKDGLSMVNSRIEETEKLLANIPSGNEDLSNKLVVMNNLKKKFTAPLEILELNKDKKIIEQDQKKLPENARLYCSEKLKNIVLADIPLEMLNEIPLNDHTQPLVASIWKDFLSRISYLKKNTTDTNSFKLQLLSAKAAVNKIKDADALKEELLVKIEQIETNSSYLQNIQTSLDELSTLQATLQEQIVKAKELIPNPIKSVPVLDVKISESVPVTLIQKFLDSKISEKSRLEKQKPNKRSRRVQADPQKIAELDALITKISSAIDSKNFASVSTEVVQIGASDRDVTKLNAYEIAALQTSLDEVKAELKAIANQPDQAEKMKQLAEKESALQAILDLPNKIKVQQAKVEELENAAKKQLEDKKVQIRTQFKELEASKMPFSKLSALKVNALNSELISEIWQQAIREAFSSGKLGQLKNFENVLKNPDVRNIVEGMKDLEVAPFIMAINAIKKLSDPLKGELSAFVDRELASNHISLDTVLGAHTITEERQMEELHPIPTTTTDILIGTVNPQQFAPIGKPDLNKSKALTPYEIDHLKILSKALSYTSKGVPHRLTEREFEHLKWFIDFARQNTEQSRALNKKLHDMLEKKSIGGRDIVKRLKGHEIEDIEIDKIPYGITSDAVKMISDLTFNLKKSDTFEKLTVKLEKLFTKIDANNAESIVPEEQLTLTELGILNKCAKLSRDSGKNSSVMKKLEQLGIMDGNTTLRGLRALSEKAKKLLSKADELYQKESVYKDGDVLVHVGEKEFKFKGREANKEEALTIALITDYTHAAKVFVEPAKDGKVPQTKLSHILGEHLKSTLNFSEACYSQVWRLDISALIPKEMQVILQDLYKGEKDDWKVIIQKKFEAIEHVIESDVTGKFKNMENSWQRRIGAGWEKFWGKKLKNERNFEKFADKFLTDDQTSKDHFKTMICSEFASKTTIAALVQLNRVLAKEVGTHLLMESATTSGEIDQAKNALGKKVLAQRAIFDLPYDKKLKFKSIHPGKTIEMLKQKNCLRQVQPPTIIQQLIRT